LSSLLERRGMEVLTATTGLEAIEMLSATDVSIVLMDIMMPEMDGYQTMQKIRSSEKNQRLPIIALTAKAMKGDREKCLEAGASDYLAKPVDTEQLLSALRMWLHRWRGQSCQCQRTSLRSTPSTSSWWMISQENS
jgi:CheY-like chemotaxis protein